MSLLLRYEVLSIPMFILFLRWNIIDNLYDNTPGFVILPAIIPILYIYYIAKIGGKDNLL
jgi:hypothetical protein